VHNRTQGGNEMSLLSVESLTVGYGNTVILSDVTFSIERGERFVVLGTSGCGKSTLLKAIVGLNPPSTGTIFFDGEEIRHPLPEEHPFYRRIGVLYQSAALLNSMTLEENVMLPIKMHFPRISNADARDVAGEKLAMVGLYEHRMKIPQELSGGMKKRGALARALVLDPEIIFFDEPQAGLDPVTTQELDLMFIRLNEQTGVTFFMVTHELLSIRRSAQRVLMLADGGVAFLGSLRDALKADEFRVRRFFDVGVST